MKIGDIKVSLLDMARCNSCSVRESSLCSGMTDNEFDRVHNYIDDVIFPAGSVLFRQGDEGHHVFTIRSGLVKLNRLRQNGELRIMRILRPSDIGGLEVVVANKYEYDAIALEPVVACRIPVKLIKELDVQSPMLHQKLLERWHLTVSEADEWMAELTSGSARARLAKLLLKMRTAAKPEMSTLFSREDIGSMLCMTMETASRTIKAFEREGKIKPEDSGGRYYRVDVHALEQEILKDD